MKLSHILTAIFCAMILAGCHASKKTVSVIPGDGDSRASFVGAVNRYPAWTDVEVPVGIDISSPVNFNISGRAKMVRGEVIDISLRMLGFEVGRLYLNQDSVFGYVKMSKISIAESLGDLTAQIPMNISNVQDLLTGGLFLLGKMTLTDSDAKDFAMEQDNSSLIMIPHDQPSIFQYGFVVDNSNRVSRFVGANGKSNIEFVCNYSDYSSGQKDLASDVDVSVSLSRPVVAEINWKWESAKWNTGISPEFSMPRGYKRVRSQEILNHLPK
ncbi:MAG: DUF4292 domain-containing protein [Bacteroides sp.]|nr:DUF4292 domain-containing protein [Bacteroides sp.]